MVSFAAMIDVTKKCQEIEGFVFSRVQWVRKISQVSILRRPKREFEWSFMLDLTVDWWWDMQVNIWVLLMRLFNRTYMFPLYRERKHCFTEYLHLPLYPKLPSIHCSPVSHPHSLQEYTRTNVMTIKNANHLKDRNDTCNCYIQITMDETHVKADVFPSFSFNHCPSQYTRKSSY